MRMRLGVIGLLVLMVASCVREVEPSVRPSRALVEIDSLMWSRPDSAFALLLEFADSPEADSLDAFNGHYCQLLVSELLYKNDYEQTNREKLLKAVDYFDSIGDVFLDARAHYIKGVGFYERDSVVEACEEYITALEIMEKQFDEKDLVGRKAQFMALVYAHLCELFSDQYLHEQAIFFAKQSISGFKKFDTDPWHVPRLYNEIGSQYLMMDILDSADYYFSKVMDALADTCNLTYRDVLSLKAILSYKKDNKPQEALKKLERLLIQSESIDEYYSRCSVIGEILFREKQYDSAYVYLNKVFLESASVGSRKQAAELLVKICKHRKRSYELYADFLVPFANQNENQSELKSMLTELYSNYIQNKKDRFHSVEMHNRTKSLLVSFVFFLVLLIISFLFIHKTRKLGQKAQREAERQSFEMRQRALEDRLTESNKALCEEQKEKHELLQELNMRRNKPNWDSIDVFLDENICREIVALLEGKVIKREAKRMDYPELKLSHAQLLQLQVVVEKHFEGFCQLLASFYPRISHDEMNQCLLCLLNLKDTQISALLQCDYSTIYRRSVKLKRVFNTEETLQVFIRNLVL